MRLIASIAASTLVLTACSAAADTAVRDDCMVLASDPVAQEQFAARDLTADHFCDCMVSYVDAQPETEEEQMTLALAEVTGEMEASEVGAEDALRTVRLETQEMDDDAGKTLGSGIRLLGGMMNAYGEDFGADDACPTP